MDDNELVDKVRAAIALANETNFGAVTFPDCDWTAEARAAIQVMREAGWKPQPKPKLMADVS